MRDNQQMTATADDDWGFGPGAFRCWYAIAASDDVRRGSSRTYRLCGRDLVVFRGRSGTVAATDPHCPHFGAHLGHGGKVVGDCIECPFHGWRFNDRGDVVGSAGVEIHPGARLRTWDVCEENGHIYVWFSPDGVRPTYRPEPLFDDGWDAPVKRYEWVIRTRASEVVENAFDRTHFDKVHGIGKPTSTAIEPSSNGFGLQVQQTFHAKVLGWTADSTLDMTLHDPANISSVLSRQGASDLQTYSALVPLDDDQLRFRFEIVAKSDAHRAFRTIAPRVFAQMSKRQLFNDVPIWENKRVLDTPLYTRLDRDLVLARRWMKSYQHPTEGPTNQSFPTQRPANDQLPSIKEAERHDAH